MARLQFRPIPACLLVVCLLHGGLLAAVMQAPAPQLSLPPPPQVIIQLIPPSPPVVSAPIPEPDPVPEPVLEPTPQPKPVPKPKPVPVKPAEPDLFAAISTEPAPAPDTSAKPVESTPAAAPSEPVFDADYLNNPAPIYPSLSRKRREEGVVLLRVHVRADGTADELEVFESSGYSRLDEAALRAVKRWQFVPAKLGDQHVAAWVRVPVRFDLKS